ncbi:MAG: EthD family reductase, partial [Gammaproteobacteria bacterium]|nr:EthD family reductase [Gammaproteobacteria bacterium]
MTGVKLTEHYPHPTDAEQFDQDYREHLALFHRNADVPANLQQYTVTRFLAAGPDKPAYYQMFSMPFPSAEA